MVFVRDDQTLVMLAPELQFEEPVLIDFVTVSMVYYWDSGQWVPVDTNDGEILVDHFSRWAWWKLTSRSCQVK